MDASCVDDRFTFDKDKTCVSSLSRAKLASIVEASAKHKKVFVYGSKGAGKSHMLNSLAFLKFSEHLMDPSQKKPHVLWIPHLGSFAAHLADHLFDALLLAA
jgi:energy-coupling factor transporter ATP-binding protein EcfA2